MLVLGVIAAFGGWILIPTALGAWLYSNGDPAKRRRRIFRGFVVLAIPVFTAVLWWAFLTTEGGSDLKPWIAAIYVGLLGVACGAMGVGAAHLVATRGRLGWILSLVMVVIAVVVAAALNLLAGLWYGGLN